MLTLARGHEAVNHQGTPCGLDHRLPAPQHPDKQARLLEVLQGYLTYLSVWFEWLEIVAAKTRSRVSTRRPPPR